MSKRPKRKKKNSAGRISFLCIGIFLALVLSVQMVRLYQKNEALVQTEQTKQNELNEQQEKQKELQEQEQYTQSNEYKEKVASRKYPSIAYELAEQIQSRLDKEVRITVPGHTQRGGSPCPYDRVIATRVGAAAAELILKGEYGYMIAIKDGKTAKVPLEEVAGKLKYVDPKDPLIKEARMIGISFGDGQEE